MHAIEKFKQSLSVIRTSHHRASRSKMESIDTKTRMKSGGSRELVEEMKKQRRLTIDDSYKVWFTCTRLFL